MPFGLGPRIVRVRVVTSGNASYGPGTVNWTCPEYNTLTIDLFGAGAGGGGAGSQDGAGQDGGTPGDTTFGAVITLIAHGGQGGQGGPQMGGGGNGANGANGTAANGDTNTTGGGEPGGSGGQNQSANGQCNGGHGGAGARCTKTYTYGAAGAPVPGTTYTLVVAAGGAGGAAAGGQFSGNPGQAGTNGAANLSWS